MHDTTIAILNKLELDPQAYGVTPYGKRRGCTNYELVHAYLFNKSTEKAALYLGYTYTSLERYMQRYWFTRYPEKGKEHWYAFFLYSIGKKECSGCGRYLDLSKYHLSTATHSKVTSKCRTCASSDNKYNYYSDRISRLLKMRDYYISNKALFKAKNASRRAARLLATPSWASKDVIYNIYKNCPIGYHVDHIIPLQGEKVCGLHVENNLQYLSAEDNLKKGNSFYIE